MSDRTAESPPPDDASVGSAAADDAQAESQRTDDEDVESTYGGILGAFPYAYRASESRLFRTYVVGGGLLAALVVVVFTLAVVVLIGQTASTPGGTFTFSRAFFLVLMVLVIAPLVGPVLSVARRHRRTGSTVRYDRGLALGGYLFVLSLYLALVVSTPEELQDDSAGLLAPVVDFLYSLPRAAGVVPPILATVVIYVLHRRLE